MSSVDGSGPDDFVGSSTSTPMEAPRPPTFDLSRPAQPWLAESSAYVYGNSSHAAPTSTSAPASEPLSFINPSFLLAPSHFPSLSHSHFPIPTPSTSLDLQRQYLANEQLRQQQSLASQQQQRAAAQNAPPAASSSSSASNSSVLPSASQQQPSNARSGPRPQLAAMPKPSTSRPSPASTSVPTTLPAPPAPQPDTAWGKVLPELRRYLTTARLQRAGISSAKTISDVLVTFQLSGSKLSEWGDSSEVPPEGRREVLTAFDREANDTFWKAWLGQDDGMDVLITWFMGATEPFVSSKATKGKAKELDTGVRPLLRILKKLPLTFDDLVKFKGIAKRVKRIAESDRIVDPEIKSIATELMNKWVEWQKQKAQPISAPPTSNAKRKAEEPEGAKKRTKVAAATTPAAGSSTAPAKAKPRPSVPPNKSTPLPSFKKEKKAEVGGLSGIAGALKGLGSSKTASSAGGASSSAVNRVARSSRDGTPNGTPPPGDAQTSGGSKGKSVLKSLLVKSRRSPGAPRRRVVFASDDALEAIKYIEKAIYDGDEEHEEAILDADDVKAMQQQEGMTLSMRLEDDMEEEVDWHEPILVEAPDADNNPEPVSLAAEAETRRQASVPEFVPNESIEGPWTPDETMALEAAASSASVAGLPAPWDDGLLDEPRMMQLGAALAGDANIQAAIASAQASHAPTGGFAANDQISSLLSQLGNVLNPATPGSHSSASSNGGGDAPIAIDPATLEQLSHWDASTIQAALASQPQLPQGALQASLQGAGVVPAASNPYGFPGNNAAEFAAGRAAVTGWQGFDASRRGDVGPPGFEGGQRAGAAMPSPVSPLGRQGAGAAAAVKGKKLQRRTPCKWFGTRKGCDWGDKCSFLHDSGNGIDVRER